ncbi:PREDICTED: uncharacterized protein LOC107330034 [Acropora digitifera]|uniref:uncharacterized protein LOC107330034 n=1 Tax=Acropora digitifera TaxID=70779 RepID=UPI00077A2861|nr:PREDICTED: uncharacterized protein LOC107330034 [Acropora digitifera]
MAYLLPIGGNVAETLQASLQSILINSDSIQNVRVSLLVPEGACNDEDKREARSFGVSILDAKECVAFEPLLWLSNPPQDHKIDVIVGHGVKLGRQVQLIKRQVQFQNCKWVHMVHTEPEDLSKYKDYSNPISRDSGDPAKWAEAIEDVRDRHGVVLEESEMLKEHYSKKFCWQKQCEELVARLWKMVCGASAAQAVAADDVTVQCATGVSESVCHTNPTAMQQHFEEGAVTSGTGQKGTAGGDLTLPELAVHLIKLKVKTSGLRKEQQKAVYKLLINHAIEYMKSRNYTTVKVPRVGAFLEYLELTYDVSCRTFNLGSLIIGLDCKTLKGLDKLWNDYLSGHLTKVAKNHLVTDEMMKSLRLKTINLKTSIDKENYVNCRKIFPESSGEYKYFFGVR